ncbi:MULTISPECIES: hypothetical protein [unclassified Streptomyces]|uniref:hypothetical protein n=1 Tax=unclassified Streptomyces TaxID=2593676 RepID=UPI0033181D3F
MLTALRETPLRLATQAQILATTAPAALTQHASMALAKAKGTEDEPRFLAHRIWQIVLIVAIAVVLVAGIVSYALVAYQCVSRGYDRVKWSGPNGWRVWEFKIICEKY